MDSPLNPNDHRGPHPPLPPTIWKVVVGQEGTLLGTPLPRFWFRVHVLLKGVPGVARRSS